MPFVHNCPTLANLAGLNVFLPCVPFCARAEITANHKITSEWFCWEQEFADNTAPAKTKQSCAGQPS